MLPLECSFLERCSLMSSASSIGVSVTSHRGLEETEVDHNSFMVIGLTIFVEHKPDEIVPGQGRR